MRSFVSKAKVGALVIGCLASALLAQAAWSDVEVVHSGVCGPGFPVQYVLTWDVNGCNGQAAGVGYYCVAAAACLPTIVKGGLPCETVYFTPCGNNSFGCWCLRGAIAGGKDEIGQLSSPVVGVSGSVGIYSSPETGGPPDTSFFTQVDRLHGPERIVLTYGHADGSGNFVAGGAAMQSSYEVGSRMRAGHSRYDVFVYPGPVTANADSTVPGGHVRDGTGAVANGKGRVDMRGRRTVSGVFVEADWTQSDGVVCAGNRACYTSRMAGGAKTIPVTGLSDTAVVVEVFDPDTNDVGAPAASPWSLALLSLALLGSGIWVIRLRSRPATA
ncbi:MAG TPA: hypothetical protein VGK93_08365 [Candidatus Eisenbacteria bacterium]|jgi:hypothetical protein